MFNSLYSDIKYSFSHGGVMTRVIILNVFIFFTLLIFKALFVITGIDFTYEGLVRMLSLPSSGWTLLKQPWSLFTHFWVHAGLWHLLWNMIILYWFGKIFISLIGERKFFPLYVLGGLGGAFFFMLFKSLSGDSVTYAHGASACVMAIIVATAYLAPHFRVHLLFIGPVKLMYIAACFIFLDLIMILNNNTNAGGNIGHLGGAFVGGFYIHYLKQSGKDLIDIVLGWFTPNKPEKTAKVVRMTPPKKRSNKGHNHVTEEEVNKILDKIKKEGIHRLTPEEKNILEEASKKIK